MVQHKHRTTAWTLAWLCVLVTAYASLYPFDDWRNQDIPPGSFVTAPWPKYLTAFDLWSNFLGYLPLGFWLCLAALRSGSSRWASVGLALSLAFFDQRGLTEPTKKAGPISGGVALQGSGPVEDQKLWCGITSAEHRRKLETCDEYDRHSGSRADRCAWQEYPRL